MSGDTYRPGSYVTNHETLDKLCECGWRISLETDGRKTTDWRGEAASVVFGKMFATCISFLRLNPKSSYYRKDPPDLWDLPSAATLCRNLIEAFYVLAYLVESPADQETRDFQKALWDYHAAFERHELLRVGVPDSKGLPDMQAEHESARIALEALPTFQQLSERHRAELLKGKAFMLPSKVDFSRALGISEKFFRFHYRHCSSYAHTSPYSVSRLGSLTAGTEKGERAFRIIAGAATAYTALALREFLRLCPDQQDSLSVEIKEAVALSEGMLRDWDSHTYSGKSDS